MTRTLYLIILIMVFIACSGCYSGINGKVVDGITGNPLEGAVVLAQWTKTHGLPGLASHRELIVSGLHIDTTVFFVNV